MLVDVRRVISFEVFVAEAIATWRKVTVTSVTSAAANWLLLIELLTVRWQTRTSTQCL